MIKTDKKVVLRIDGRSYREKDLDYIVNNIADRMNFKVHHYNCNFGKFKIKICGTRKDSVIFKEVDLIDLINMPVCDDYRPLIEMGKLYFIVNDIELWATDYIKGKFSGKLYGYEIHSDKILVKYFLPDDETTILTETLELTYPFLKEIDSWLMTVINRKCM